MMTTEAAAVRLGISESAVRAACASGRIRGARREIDGANAVWRIPPAAMARFEREYEPRDFASGRRWVRRKKDGIVNR